MPPWTGFGTHFIAGVIVLTTALCFGAIIIAASAADRPRQIVVSAGVVATFVVTYLAMIPLFILAFSMIVPILAHAVPIVTTLFVFVLMLAFVMSAAGTNRYWIPYSHHE